jgi:glycosyltransferase involved in cell wall biosynthesis
MAMIICTVTNDLSQDQRMIRICSSLSAAGHQVTLVGRLRTASLPLVDRDFTQHRLNCWFDSGKFFYLEYNLRLLIFLLRQQTDIINAVDLDTLFPAYLLSRLRKRIICVYDAHEYFTEVPEVIRRPLVQKVWSFLAEWIIPKLEYAYTVGPALAKLFTERYGTHFQVVRNVPFRKPIKKAVDHQNRTILYQGMLNEGRGLETAIQALKLLPETFTLLLVGSGDVELKLRQLVEQENLQNRVHFTGFIPPDQLAQYTEQAWLGLNLLENTGLSYYYSLANKAFDYIQAGLPSVQMDFPEYRALQEEYHTYLLLHALDPQQLASLILALAQAPERYADLVANNHKAAELLNWEEEESRLLEIYQEISSRLIQQAQS